MSPLELLLFGSLCYLFGLVSGAVLIPGSWTGASSRSAGMSDERQTASEHPAGPRQVSAVLLIAAVVVIVLDVIVEEYEVNPPVLLPAVHRRLARSSSIWPSRTRWRCGRSCGPLSRWLTPSASRPHRGHPLPLRGPGPGGAVMTVPLDTGHPARATTRLLASMTSPTGTQRRRSPGLRLAAFITTLSALTATATQTSQGARPSGR